MSDRDRDHITAEAWFGPGGPAEREPGLSDRPGQRDRDIEVAARVIADRPGEPGTAREGKPLDGWVADIFWYGTPYRG